MERSSSQEPPQRNHPVHLPPKFNHSRPIILFITVCTHQRQRLLDNSQAHGNLLQAWGLSSDWKIGRYVIMPDHVHFFCTPFASDPAPLKNWMAYWKSASARKWPTSLESKVWQRDFWDTQLRTTESYESKWAYVRQNPVRAGLVSLPDAWPYQGEIHSLAWHD